MRGKLSSARMRRRLAWLGGLMVVAGAIAGLVLAFPGPKPSPAEKMLKGKARVIRTPKHHSFAPQAGLVMGTAKAFVLDGVMGKDLGTAWKYVGPKMRQGFTRYTWVHGSTLPFQLYPADPARTRFNVSFSYANEVGMRLLLFARPHAKVHPRRIAFDLVEQKYGHGAKTRYLVSSFTPAPGGGGEGGGGGSSEDAVAKASAAEEHTSATWLLLPAGIFGGLLLGLGTFFGIRSWRNAVAYRSYFENRQTSNWRPS